MGLGGRLSDGRAQLRGSAIGIGEALGTGAIAQERRRASEEGGRGRSAQTRQTGEGRRVIVHFTPKAGPAAGEAGWAGDSGVD